MKSGNYSYETMLCKQLELVKPQLILEWGPGFSTIMMAEQCPDADIFSIEHDKTWLEITKNRLEPYSSKIRLFYKQADTRASQYATNAYSLYDKLGPFDLIFIDGRRRVECCFVAMDIIKDTGVIIMHDAERKSYRRIIDKYINIIDEHDRTIAFKKL